MMIIAGLALAALESPLPIAVQCPEEKCVPGLSAADVFGVANQVRAEGRLDEAEELLRALLQDPDPEIRMEARFRLGKSRMERGFVKEAVTYFAAILEERPRAAPVRLEYARALAALGRHDAALRQLQRAQTGGLPEEVQRAVDRISSALRSAKPWGGSVELGIAPDTNINQATAQRFVDIFGIPLELSKDARARSGIGLTFAGQLYRRVPIAANTNLLGTVATEGTVYDLKSGNDISLNASLGPEFRQIRPSLLVGRRWYGGNGYSFSYGAAVRAVRALDRTSQIDAGISVQRSLYERIEEQNATTVAANVAIERALSPTLFGRISLFALDNRAVAKAYSYVSGGTEAVLSQDLGALTIYGRLGYTLLRGKAPFAIFGEKRSDDRVEASVGLAWRRLDLAGSNPVIRLTHSRNFSALALYEFKRTRLEVVLSRPF